MKLPILLLRSLVAVSTAVFPSFLPAAPSASSAYVTDAQNSFVADQTSEGINQVNMIMCFMGAMKPDSLVNQGNYLALVDDTKCDASGRDKVSNSGSGSSASTASQYVTATVNSSRASNSDPMIGKVWVEDNENGQQMTIFVRASATSAPTSTNPYGVFRMDFCGKASGGSSCMFNGFIDASSTGLSYYENGSEGGGSRTIAMTLNATDGTTSGTGKMSIAESFGGSTTNSTFTFAYNSSYFRRDDGTNDQCFSRDAADSGTGFSVWRYGLYDADTGARITRNSGFPIEYTSGGTTHHGYMGYWGLWLPQDVLSAISSGATVQKVTYGADSATKTDYTLLKAGGKLTKYTKGTKTLAQIDKIRFNFWASASSGPGGLSGYAQGTTYEAYWDNTNNQFVITGYQSCGSSGCNTVSITEVATTNSYWSTNYAFGLSGWSQALGGEVFIATGDADFGTDATLVDVAYRTQDLVYPSQYSSIGDLRCIVDCPTASGIAALLANSAQTPYGSTAGSYSPTSSLVSYTLNSSTGNMIDAASAAVTTSSTSLTGMYQWGIRSGKLFPSSAATTVDAADGATDGNYTAWGVDSLDVYYVWETGPNGWNQFSAVKDANGTFVQFDAPLNVNFTVPNSAAYGDYAGKTILLQYNGFGDLFGIPGKCVKAQDNTVTSCDTANARYVPSFAIPYDQTIGKVTNGSTTYLVKWLDREIRLAKKTVADCTAAGLSLPSGVTLPTSAGLKDPSSSSSDVYIGTKPTVTDAPRVIHGVVQY